MRTSLRRLLAAAWLLPLLAAGCVSTPESAYQRHNQTWTEKVGASFKSGADRLASAVTPKPKFGTNVESQNVLQPDKKPGPGVYVALAEMNERNGNVAEAETQLRKALAIDPNYLGALLAYAHLEDRQRNFQAATKYYNRALKKHSKNAGVHNDMGLCFHRHNQLDNAANSLTKAVELEPHKKLYRTNLAAVLVDQGKPSEALAQLVEANGRPVGHYNLAYMLMQKHDNAAALHHFRLATQLDPTFTEARQWVAQLSRPPAGYPPTTAGHPVAMVAQRSPRAGYAPGSTAAVPAYVAAGTQPPGGYYPQPGVPQPGQQPGQQPAQPQGNYQPQPQQRYQ